MGNFILSIGLALFLFSCTQGKQEKYTEQINKVEIKGTLTGETKGHDKVFMYTRMATDSTTIQDGHFSFEFPFEGRTTKFFYTEYTVAGNRSYAPFALLIDGPGVITIKGEIETGFDKVEVSGSEAAEVYLQYKKNQGAIYQKISNQVKGRYGKAWLSPKDEAYEAFQKTRDSLTKICMVPLIEDLVRNNPDNYATVFVLAGGAKNFLSIEEQKTLYTLLSDDMKQSEEGQRFYAHTQGLKNSSIGSMTKNFTLPDPNGNPVDFSLFRGDYVLIDFWASWCAPCRRSFPRMRQVYDIFKDDGFKIYSISIDENKEAWLKAVKEENNPWPQSLDTKNIAASGFAVTAVPTTYLIDPDGKIIMKEIGFDPEGGGAIEVKLEELFDETIADQLVEKASQSQKTSPMTKMK